MKFFIRRGESLNLSPFSIEEHMKYLLTFLAAFAAVWVLNSFLSGHEISYFTLDKLILRLGIALVITTMIWRRKSNS